MSDKEKIVQRPEQVKLPIEELEILAELSDTTYFMIVKRVARRYVEHLKTLSFSLRAEDANFAIKHTRYIEQAVGMELLIKIIADARKAKAEITESEE